MNAYPAPTFLILLDRRGAMVRDSVNDVDERGRDVANPMGIDNSEPSDEPNPR